jgi:hypothetical protein
MVCLHVPNVNVKGSERIFMCADALFFLMTGQKTDRDVTREEDNDLDNDFHTARRYG